MANMAAQHCVLLFLFRTVTDGALQGFAKILRGSSSASNSIFLYDYFFRRIFGWDGRRRGGDL